MRLLSVIISLILGAASTAQAGSDFSQFVQQIREGEVADEPQSSSDSADEPKNETLLASAYSMKTLLVKALDDARSIPLGPRIQFYMQRTELVLQQKYQAPHERYARLALERSHELAKVTLDVAGQNAELVAQWSANFYRTSFELAISLLNNPRAIRSSQGASETSDYLKSVSLAQFGYFYSTLLWRNTANVTSDTAKAVMLLRMVHFLGQDFNSDLRRREPRFREVIADIYFLQKEDISYARVVTALQQMQEPQAADLAALRVKVYKIWTSLASKLSETGVETKFIER